MSVKLNCEICNKEFIVKPYRKDTAKFCSQKCMIIALEGYKKTDKWKKAVNKFNKTQKPHLGKPHSEETKKEISEIRKANPNRYWLGKKQPHHQGENNVNWKGGVTSENEKERKSGEYLKWRIKVFKRDNFKCRVCLGGGYIQAHHIYPFADNKELRFKLSNGITLCPKCHRITFKREYLSIKHFQGIIENGLNSAKAFEEVTPSQQERLRKALWACVTVSDE